MIGTDANINLEKDTVKDLKAMVEAGLEVVELHNFLIRTSENFVKELLPKKEVFYQFNLSSFSNITAYESPPQLFCQALRSDRHAHFHILLRDKTISKNNPGAGQIELDGTDWSGGKSRHLFALSMDLYGIPIRLFTASPWTTGENWGKARDVFAKIERFQFTAAKPPWVVNRWVIAMLRLFRPQIREMLEKRDTAVAKWRQTHTGKHIFGDWELCFPSIKEVSVEEQNGALLNEVTKRLCIHSNNARLGLQRSLGDKLRPRTNFNKTFPWETHHETMHNHRRGPERD